MADPSAPQTSVILEHGPVDDDWLLRHALLHRAIAESGAAPSIPGGPAGGKLLGTYPNPTFAPTGVAPGTYGGSTDVGRFTVAADGTVSFAANVPIAFPPALPPSISNVAAQNVLKGQPVYADQITGQFKLADASALTKSSVIGLVDADTLATFVASADQLQITLPDWTSVIGSAALALGQIYFLGTTPGTLTTTAPVIPGQAVTRVGVALTTQKMDIAIQAPILL